MNKPPFLAVFSNAGLLVFASLSVCIICFSTNSLAQSLGTWNNTDHLIFGQAVTPTEFMRLSTGGNLGIGTTTPAERLDIGAVGTALSTLTQSSSARMALSGSFWDGVAEVQHRFILQNVASTTVNEDGRLTFSWDATELFSVLSSGSVGIGISAPLTKLHIAGGDVNLDISRSYRIGNEMVVNRVGTEVRVGSNLVTDLMFRAGTEKMRIKTSGDVGIGTPTPAALLDISGDGSTVLLPRKSTTGDPAGGINGMIYYNEFDLKFRMYENGVWKDLVPAGGGGGWTDGGTDIFVTTVTDHVGIGTTTPGGKLTIDDANLADNGNEDNTELVLQGSDPQIKFSDNSAGFHDWWIQGVNNNLQFLTSSTPDGIATTWSAVRPLTLTNAGNVGIGTVSPGANLEVSGDTWISENPDGGGAGSDSYQFKLVGRVAGPLDRSMILQNIAEIAGDEYRLGILNDVGTEIMSIEDDGNVGIGIISPTSPLTIQPVSGTDILFAGGATNADIMASNEFRVGTTNGSPFSLLTSNAFRMTIDGSGNVGIGTTAPFSLLHVLGTADPLEVTVENGGGNFKTGYTVKTALNEWFIGQESSSASGFRITDIDAASVRLQIDQGGNVGIGTITPAYKLDVTGDSRIGWHGSSTRIKILPSDFLGSAQGIDKMLQITNASPFGVRPNSCATSCPFYWAFVSIPEGYKAVDIMINGNNANAIIVYEANLSTGVYTQQGTSGTVGATFDFPDFNSTATNCLAVYINLGVVGDIFYGGYVTIAPIP